MVIAVTNIINIIDIDGIIINGLIALIVSLIISLGGWI